MAVLHVNVRLGKPLFLGQLCKLFLKLLAFLANFIELDAFFSANESSCAAHFRFYALSNLILKRDFSEYNRS